MYRKKSLILKKFIEEINQSKEKVNKISVIRNNRKVEEYIWEDRPVQNMHSVAKTMVSLAVGFAVKDDFLSLDDTISSLYPKYVNANNESVLSRLSLRHLLSLSIGQEQAYLMLGQRDGMIQQDWIDFSLNQSFSHQPGEKFKYSNVGPYLAGIAIERATGEKLSQYLERKLFHPLEIDFKGWEEDPQGHSFGAGGILFSSKDFEKLTYLLLNKGYYKKKSILSTEWIETISSPVIEVEKDDPFSTHYGFGLWIDERTESFRMDGAFGQLGIVFPIKQAAVVVNSRAADNQILIEKINRLIYPQL